MDNIIKKEDNMDYQIICLILSILIIALLAFGIFLINGIKNQLNAMRKKQEDMLKHTINRNNKIIELIEKSVLEDLKEKSEILELINNNVNDLKIEEEIKID